MVKKEQQTNMQLMRRSKDLARSHGRILASVDPLHSTGLEPAPKDRQYEVPPQLGKPVDPENQNENDDIRHWYNDKKYSNSWAYAQNNNTTKPVAAQ